MHHIPPWTLPSITLVQVGKAGTSPGHPDSSRKMEWLQPLFYRQKGPGGPACRAASSMSSFVQDELNKVAHRRVNQAELGIGPGQKNMVLNLNHNPNFPKGNV